MSAASSSPRPRGARGQPRTGTRGDPRGGRRRRRGGCPARADHVGYMFASADEAASVAHHSRTIRFSATGALREARPVSSPVASAELGDDGRATTAPQCSMPSGLRAVYRKLHLWIRKSSGSPREGTPGDRHARRPGGGIICYDLDFPEFTRWWGWRGRSCCCTDQLAAVERPEGSGRRRSSSRWRPRGGTGWPWPARTGRDERGKAWTGCATIIAADGWVAAEARELSDRWAQISTSHWRWTSASPSSPTCSRSPTRHVRDAPGRSPRSMDAARISEVRPSPESPGRARIRLSLTRCLRDAAAPSSGTGSARIARVLAGAR